MDQQLAGTAAYVEDQYNAAREAAAEMDREYKIQENYAAACARAKEIDEQYAISEQVAQAKVSMQAAMSKFNEDYEISRTASQKAAELDAEYNLSQRANETFSSMRHSWYAWWGSPSTMEEMTQAAQAPCAPCQTMPGDGDPEVPGLKDSAVALAEGKAETDQTPSEAGTEQPSTSSTVVD